MSQRLPGVLPGSLFNHIPDLEELCTTRAPRQIGRTPAAAQEHA